MKLNLAEWGLALLSSTRLLYKGEPGSSKAELLSFLFSVVPALRSAEGRQRLIAISFGQAVNEIDRSL